MWVIFVALTIAACIWYSKRKVVVNAAVLPKLAGTGDYLIEVVGESNYTANFEKICGPRTPDGVRMTVRAQLILENTNRFDGSAVRVDVQGLTVGYLPRLVAKDFRRAIASAGLAKATVFECGGLIQGGWDNGRGDRGHYGIRLDLPLDDK